MSQIATIDRRHCLLIILVVVAILIGRAPSTMCQESTHDSSDSVGVQPRVTNVFYETDLREVLMNISDQTGVTIVADQSVRGYITMAVTNQPLENCLRQVLQPLGFAFRKVDDYYFVGSATPDNPSFSTLSRTETMTPSYLTAEAVSRLMSRYYDPYVRVDSATNRLSITASPEVIERFKMDMKAIDVPARQVMIEAMVTEITDESLKELGVSALVEGDKDGRHYSIGYPLGGLSDSGLSVSGVRIGDLWSGWTVDYQATVNALIRKGEAKIRANPKLATQEGQTARIYIGKDQYHTIATGRDPYVYTRLEVIKVGIALEITPYVSQAGEISVSVRATVSDVTGMGATGLPVVNTRDVATRIKVADGESIVIGGLQQEDSSKIVRKVPILGDIPLLGLLFRNTSTNTRTSEIVILITPHLLSD